MPAEDRDGNHVILNEYDSKGNLITITQKKKDGQANLIPNFDVATQRKVYDADGNWTEHINLGTKGDLVVGPYGYARYQVTYGPGQKKVWINYGANNKVMLNPLQGYAIKQTDKSTGILITEESYYDADRTLINSPSGYAVVKRLRSKTGEILEEAFYRPDGKPAFGPQGFFRMVRSTANMQPTYFDRQNKVILNFNPDKPDPSRFMEISYVRNIENLGSIAYKNGLRPGDVFWSYSKKSQKAIMIRTGEKIILSIPPSSNARLGVVFDVRYIPLKNNNEKTQAGRTNNSASEEKG